MDIYRVGEGMMTPQQVADMTGTISVQEAESSFSDLLERVSRGEEVTILRNGEAIARLVPTVHKLPRRTPGSAKGLMTIAPDFDDPLPDDILDAFNQ
jgi:prevent-host-death family protein